MSCPACVGGIQASIVQLLQPATLEAIVAAYEESGFCEASPEPRCAEFLAKILREGIPMLEAGSHPEDFPAVCNQAVEGTCA